MYIYFCSENVPRQTFLSPGQRNVEKPWPRIFRLSVFHQSHPLLFFPVSPFFSPSSVLSTLCFSALFAASGWKRWKLGRWVRGWGKCVCVCVWRVRAMIGEFSGKAPPNCEFRACFSPLSCLLWLVNGLVLFIHHSPSFVIRLSQRY